MSSPKDFLIGAILIAVSIAIPGGFLAGIPAMLALSAGVGFASSGIFGTVASLAAREVGVESNVPNTQNAIPVVYGSHRVGLKLVDIRNQQVGLSNLLVAGALAHGSANNSGLEAIGAIYFNDKLAIAADGTVQDDFKDSGGTPVVSVAKYLGTNTQNVDSTFNTSNSLAWPSTSKGHGVAYLVFVLTWDQEVYGTGLPKIIVDVQGQKCFDPRDSSTVFTTNPALCIRDYLTSTVYGVGAATAEIDDASFIAAANYCEEQVTDPAGGTIDRFECNGWVDTSRRVAENLAQLLTSCRGNIVYEGGTFRLVIRQAQSATSFVLDEDSIVRDSFTFRTPGIEETPNIIRAQHVITTPGGAAYASDTVQWPHADVTNTFKVADGGYEVAREIQLPFTRNSLTAEQIAMVVLKESRSRLACTVLALEVALELQVGDVVPVTHSTPGWTSKHFWVDAVKPRPDGLVELALTEYDVNAYAIDTQTQFPSPPDTELPDPFTVEPITSLVVSSDPLAGVGGALVPRLKATWTASIHTFVARYEVQFKQTADSIWIPAPNVPHDSTLETHIDVGGGVSWDVRVRTVSTMGATSAWVQGSIDVPIPKRPRLPGGALVVMNGDFEEGGALIDDPDSGWIIAGGSNANITYDTSTEITGLRSLKMAIPTSGSRSIYNVNIWRVVPGQFVGFGAVGRLSNVNMGVTTCRIRIAWHDAADAFISEKLVYFTTTTNTYKQVLGVSPTGAVTARVYIVGINAAVAGNFFVDNVGALLELSDLPPWAPIPIDPFVPRPIPRRPKNPKGPLAQGEKGLNLIYNGDASDGLTNFDSGTTDYDFGKGWPTRLGITEAAARPAQTVVDVDDAVVGSSVFRFIGTSQGMISEQLIPITPTLWYELSAVLIRRASTVNSSENILLEPFDKDGVRIQSREWRNGGSEGRTQVNGALSGGETTITVDAGAVFGGEGSLSNSYIAFDVDSSAGSYSDLPNRDVYKLASRSGNVLTIDSGTFGPIANNAWVRKHISSGAYIYAAAIAHNTHLETVGDHVLHTGSVGPDTASPIAPWSDPNGSTTLTAFPKGTRYVRVGCLINNAIGTTATIDLDRFIFRRKIDPADVRSVGADQVGEDGGNKQLPAGMTTNDGATFLGLNKGIEVWEAEHNDAITYVGGPYQDVPIIRVLGGLGYQPATNKFGTRAQADSDSGYGVTGDQAKPMWPLLRGESITTSACTVAALLEQLSVTLTPRSVTMTGASLTVAGSSSRTDMPSNLPANNDEFTFDYTSRVKICVAFNKTPDWANISMSVTCDLDDGAGWDVVASNTYDNEATGLNNCSDSGTVARSRTITWPGMDNGDDCRMSIVSVTTTGNVGSWISVLDQQTVSWDSFVGNNDYARATDATHRVTVLVVPAITLQTA